MGMELGQIIWMILYPTERYLDQSLANENIVWGQDYTWDSIIYRRELTPQEMAQGFAEPITDLVPTASMVRS